MSTLLFVEDSRDLARMVIQELESNGYQVRHAMDGETALQIFRRSTPDLVILDWPTWPARRNCCCLSGLLEYLAAGCVVGA